MVSVARKHFPHLQIYARAEGWFESFELIQAGVNHVYRQNADTALRAGIDALRDLGFRAHQVHRLGQRFLRHDDEAMVELAKSWGDETAYFSAARERIANLEQIMLAEHYDKKIIELSVDMKCKVSLAIAIVTKPCLLILDEPTSGLDVKSMIMFKVTCF